MEKRHFTPAEVNRLIPELERIIRYLRRLEGEIQAKEWRLREAKVEAKRRGEEVDAASSMQSEAEAEFLRIVARSQYDRIRELGGQVKGGFVVDFPARINGEEVLLCWSPGEPAVQWYHGLYEGKGQRKPIPADLLDWGSTEPSTEE